MRRVVLIALLAAPAAAAEIHTVQSGEFLGGIAEEHGCSVDAIKRANRLKSDLIRAGQNLRIPKCRGRRARVEHSVTSGDTLAKLARRYGCQVADLQRANAMEGTHLSIGDVLRIPRCDGSPVPAAAAARSKPRKRRRAPKLKPGRHRVDTALLSKLMRAKGFRPPQGFKALVVEITLARSGATIERERPFSWNTTYDDSDWNPGSTVKLFSAIGALELLQAKGLQPNALATFHRGGKSRKFRVDHLVRDALGASKNHAHNRLVEIAGYDFLNGRVLNQNRGFQHAAIHRPYERGTWPGQDTFKNGGPKIVLRLGKRVRTLHGRKAKHEYVCSGSGACATPNDLAEAMRRLMLHEQIPKGRRFKLDPRALRTVRDALKSVRKRGNEVATALRRADRRGRWTFYHKPGFAGEWMSDVVYIYQRRSRRRWVVVLAGHPGRDAVESAARVVGELIAEDAFVTR